MISERYVTRKVFGNNPWDIEIADGSTFEHYGYGWTENPSQYYKEKYYHKIHNKFSWEG